MRIKWMIVKINIIICNNINISILRVRIKESSCISWRDKFFHSLLVERYSINRRLLVIISYHMFMILYMQQIVIGTYSRLFPGSHIILVMQITQCFINGSKFLNGKNGLNSLKCFLIKKKNTATYNIMFDIYPSFLSCI